MGRRATPTAIKKLRGADPRYINDEQPRFAAPANIRAPAILGKEGRKLWKDLAPHLIEHDLLAVVDIPLLTQLCIAYELMTDARAKITEEGLFRRDEEGVQRKHPGMQVWRDALMAYAKLAAEFGLSPLAREKLHVEPREEDPYEQYLRSRNQ